MYTSYGLGLAGCEETQLRFRVYKVYEELGFSLGNEWIPARVEGWRCGEETQLGFRVTGSMRN